MSVCGWFLKIFVILLPICVILKTFDMKKILQKTWRAAVLTAALATSLTAGAELLLSDSFNYAEGNLYGNGEPFQWIKLNNKTAKPIQVVNDALTFKGYQSTAQGKAVELIGDAESSASDQALKRAFSDVDMTEGELYYSLLVKPMECPQSNTTKFIIAGMAAKNFNGWGDGAGNTSPYNTVSITKGSQEGKFKFGLASSTSAPTLLDDEYDLGKTYLVVVKYKFDGKDISIWINPADATAEPSKVLAGGGSVNVSHGVRGVALYQQGNTNAQGRFIVDQVRVATDMASLFEDGGEDQPELKITMRDDFTGEAAPINEITRLATFTVEAKNLEAPVNISLTGSDMFNVSSSQIPAGTGTHEVVVSFQPTTIGRHSATLRFDAVPTTLSNTYRVASVAYDPQNPPTITVPESVEPFSAEVLTTQEKTINISCANVINLVHLELENLTAEDVFQIDHEQLLASGEVKITFAPQGVGDFAAILKVYSLLVEPQYISLSGHATGDFPPEPKQGGELTLNKTNPLAYFVENFDDVSHNQPLEISRWDNVAVTGPRAWWGYNFSDGNHGGAAKVTVYDSGAEYYTPCEMLRVTPALDFKNAISKVFTCSVMGDFMPEEGTSNVLEVLYIEDKDYMEPLQGMNIPYIADQDKEWVDYVIDFDGQPLADVFFIGFRLKSNRGRDEITTYYVDNVSWGSPITGVDDITVKPTTIDAYDLMGRKLISAGTETDVQNLPSGIYIVNGKKIAK